MANLHIPSTRDRTLDAFKGKMVGGGARPNLFECELFFPDDAIPINSSKDEIADKSRFLVKSAQLPASNIAPILVPFRGRNIKIAGDRTIGEWPITCYNDTNFKLRNAFERWQNGINNMSDNEGLTNPVDYQVDAFVDHLDRNGNTVKSYTLRGVFPTVVAPIELTYDEQTAIEQFDVTFNYQYFESNTTT